MESRTIKIEGTEITLWGEFQPKEKATNTSPGCDERFTVGEAEIFTENMLPLLEDIFNAGVKEGMRRQRLKSKGTYGIPQAFQLERVEDYLESLIN